VNAEKNKSNAEGMYKRYHLPSRSDLDADPWRPVVYNEIVLPQLDEKLRNGSSHLLYLFEAILYISVGVLLAAAAVAVLVDATGLLWGGIVSRTIADYALHVLDQLLVVLVLVEILHTVRMSIRSKEISIEPFLIVGLMATIRRVLVITMQAAKLTEEGRGPTDSTAFQKSMIELGLLGFLVVTFVASIFFLRRASGRDELVKD